MTPRPLPNAMHRRPASNRLVMVLLAAVLLTAAACSTDTPAPADAGMASSLVYVGTASGDSTEGVHTLRFDPEAETLESAGEVTPILNPSFLSLSPDGQTLYAVSETGAGMVAAFHIDGTTGALSELNRVSSGGAGPAYVSTDTTGRWVLAANYGGGSVALLPVEAGGRLGEPADVVQHEGSGPNTDRQEAPHAHYARVSPDNRYVYAADLGTDQVIAYPLDAERGSLNADAAVVTETAPGAGPRHLAFHPNGRFVYVINELDGTVTAYDYDATTGALTPIHTVSTLPDDFEGANSSADIHVHPSGRWLYASNRGDADGIAIFSIDSDTGRLTHAGYQDADITWPRNFAIDPTGRFVLVASRRANEVRVFTLDPATGALSPTEHYVTIASPTNVTFSTSRTP